MCSIYYLEFEWSGFHAVTTPNWMHHYTNSTTTVKILRQILQWDYIHNSVSSRGKKSPLVLLFHRDWIEMILDGTEQTQEVTSTLVMCSNLSLLSTFNSMTMKLKWAIWTPLQMCHQEISLVSISTCTFSEILIVFIALIVLNVLTHQNGFAKQEFFLPLVHQKSTSYSVNKFVNMVTEWLVVLRTWINSDAGYQ